MVISTGWIVLSSAFVQPYPVGSLYFGLVLMMITEFLSDILIALDVQAPLVGGKTGQQLVAQFITGLCCMRTIICTCNK